MTASRQPHDCITTTSRSPRRQLATTREPLLRDFRACMAKLHVPMVTLQESLLGLDDCDGVIGDHGQDESRGVATPHQGFSPSRRSAFVGRTKIVLPHVRPWPLLLDDRPLRVQVSRSVKTEFFRGSRHMLDRRLLVLASSRQFLASSKRVQTSL